MKRFVFLVLSYIATHSLSYADFVIAIGSKDGLGASSNLQFSAGSDATVGLYFYNTLQNTDTSLSNFGLAFDIVKPGAVSSYDGNNPEFLSNLTNFRIAIASPFDANPFSVSASPTNPDGIVSSDTPANGYDFLADFTVNTPSTGIIFPRGGTRASAIHFADITFKVADSMASGVYGFKFNPNAQFDNDPRNNVNSGFAGVTTAAEADGAFRNQFTITAVPEPSSWMLATGAAIIGIVSYRRHRRDITGAPSDKS